MDDQDRIVSAGERPDVLKENQRDSSKDERAAPAKRAPPVLVTGTSSHVAAEQPMSSVGGGEIGPVVLEPYDGPSWSDFQQYLTSDGMHLVSPVMYSDSPTLMYNAGYV